MNIEHQESKTTGRVSDIDGEPTVWPERYHMLDGWRGIAALAVVYQHIMGGEVGHYAVMLFFVISGYCITAAAESGRRKGIGLRQFMLRRARRIYPPYLASLLFFTLTRLVKAARGGPHFFPRPILDWVQNLTLTQWLTLVHHPQSWPAANPTLFVTVYWSLGYEEQFYLVIGLIMTVAGWVRHQTAIIGLMGAALIWNLLNPHLCYGIFIEYWLHFGIGAVLYYRLCRTRHRWGCLAIDVGFALSAVLAGFVARTGGSSGSRPLPIELCITATFAVILVILRPWNERFRVSAVGSVLTFVGLISYSLYLIHQFNLVFVAVVASHILPAHTPHLAELPLLIILHLIMATVFWYLCERPFLNRSAVPSCGPVGVNPGRRYCTGVKHG